MGPESLRTELRWWGCDEGSLYNYPLARALSWRLRRITRKHPRHKRPRTPHK